MPETENQSRRNVPISVTLLAAGAVLAVILAMVYVGSRLETIEDQLGFAPPQAVPATDPSPEATSTGRAVYVPAYSHIYSRGGEAFLLEITLSVRNTDPHRSIRINQVRYFDTAGRQIRELNDGAIMLGPLQTASYLVEKQDVEGGSGANFIVDWSADDEVNPPIFEAVMVGVNKDQNLSFTSRGIPIAHGVP